MSPIPVSGTAKTRRRKKLGYITYDFLSHFPPGRVVPRRGTGGGLTSAILLASAVKLNKSVHNIPRTQHEKDVIGKTRF